MVHISRFGKQDGQFAAGVRGDECVARVLLMGQLAAGVYFRVLLGGITGHRSFGSDAGIVVPPERCVAVVAAMLRVFAGAGDRTNRKRARWQNCPAPGALTG